MSLSLRHETPSSGILSFAAENSEEERERVGGRRMRRMLRIGNAGGKLAG